MRYNQVRSNVAVLAFYVEQYKQAHGDYPKSMQSLVSSVDPLLVKTLEGKLQDDFHDVYNYSALSNGFAFRVVAPKMMLVSYAMIERVYHPGEALKEYYVAITNDVAR